MEVDVDNILNQFIARFPWCEFTTDDRGGNHLENHNKIRQVVTLYVPKWSMRECLNLFHLEEVDVREEMYKVVLVRGYRRDLGYHGDCNSLFTWGLIPISSNNTDLRELEVYSSNLRVIMDSCTRVVSEIEQMQYQDVLCKIRNLEVAARQIKHL